MRWWDWDDARLGEAMPLLCSGDIAALHAFWREWAL
jgi:chloramphenicol O-acetyltransferase type B